MQSLRERVIKSLEALKNQALLFETKQLALKQLLDKASRKSRRNRVALGQVWHDLQAMIRLLKAYTRGQYRQLPAQTVLSLIAVILYFLNPLDVIPDFLPIAGYMDDAMAIQLVLLSLRADVERYLSWEEGQSQSKPTS